MRRRHRRDDLDVRAMLAARERESIERHPTWPRVRLELLEAGEPVPIEAWRIPRALRGGIGLNESVIVEPDGSITPESGPGSAGF